MFLDIYYKDKKKSDKITVNDFIQGNYKREDKISLELEYFYYYLFEILDKCGLPEFSDAAQNADKGRAGACYVLERLIDIYFQNSDEEMEYLKYLLKKDPSNLEDITEVNSLFFDLGNSYVILKIKKYGYVKFSKLKFYNYFGIDKNIAINLKTFTPYLKKC